MTAGIQKADLDGAILYLVSGMPSELPPVRGRDVLDAWEAARGAANRSAWAQARAFRFGSADRGWTEIALGDRDARCWAGAVDRAVGLQTAYGLAVCLRLLALIDLLSRAPWAAGLVVLGAEQAGPHSALLKLAAEVPMTDDARFDEAGFLARLPTLPRLGRFRERVDDRA